jgi:CubicO group peptidase (beta-lactamase class C family)
MWAIAAALVVSACSDSGSSVSSEELQPIVDEWAERHAVSDVAVSVRSPSGSFTSAVYSTGDEAPNDSSLWMIGSVNKTMTAATVLLLVEDGTLDLDEPIERWLPEFPRADEITLRMLLSHTAGMAAWDGPIPDSFGPAALEVYLEPVTVADNLAVAVDSVGDMGLPAAFEYSNPGYWVVGAVIEAATGEPVADVLRDRILEPLGMEDTYFAWSESVDGPVVPGELELPDGNRVPVGSEFIPPTATRNWTAGGAASSSRDTAAFFGALFDDLLAPESVEAMKTGLGIVTTSWPDGKDGWYHKGGTIGYVCAAGVNEDGWAVAVLTNRVNVEDLVAWREGLRVDPIELVGGLLAHLAAEE